MNILLISPTLPYPLYDGLKLRIYNLFKHIRKDYKITLVCFDDNDEKSQYPNLDKIFPNIYRVFHKETVSLPTDINILKKISNVLRFSINLPCDSEAMREKINKVIKDNRFDLVYAVHLDSIPYILNIESIPLVVDLVDSLTLHAHRRVKTSSGLLEKLQMLKRYLIVRKIERRYVSQLLTVILSSAKDAEITRSLCPDVSVQVIPNGVDLNYFYPQNNGVKESLLFTGAMDYLPNAKAMLHFCKDIFPKILQKRPVVELNIVGRNPPLEIVNITAKEKNVKVIGHVDDLRPFFEQAELYVCPMHLGAGIKNKILEAFAMKKAVVATSLSCEGIQVENGKNILLANSTDDFVHCILRLLHDEGLRIKLGENARALVEEKYTWHLQSKKLEELFEHIVSSGLINAKN